MEKNGKPKNRPRQMYIIKEHYKLVEKEKNCPENNNGEKDKN